MHPAHCILKKRRVGGGQFPPLTTFWKLIATGKRFTRTNPGLLGCRRKRGIVPVAIDRKALAHGSLAGMDSRLQSGDCLFCFNKANTEATFGKSARRTFKGVKCACAECNNGWMSTLEDLMDFAWETVPGILAIRPCEIGPVTIPTRWPPGN
jgi:hypothetical protein